MGMRVGVASLYSFIGYRSIRRDICGFEDRSSTISILCLKLPNFDLPCPVLYR